MVVKKRLADLFGKLSGFLYNQLSRQTLERKIQFYKDYLTMLDKVDPGVTKVLKNPLLYCIAMQCFILLRCNALFYCVAMLLYCIALQCSLT